MNAQQIEQTAANWLAQRTSGQWSDADRQRFEAWIDESLAHRIAYVRVESVWNQVGRLQAVGAGNARGSVPARGAPIKWVPPVVQTPPVSAAPQRKLKRPLMAIAASVVLAVAVGCFVLAGLFMQQRYSTQIGRIDTVALADGSDVTLNTDSHIRVHIGSGERRVELDKGEAFFRVAKDASRPFVVAIGDKRVVAVGTEFSVQRLRNDIRVTVSEGAVRIENFNAGQGRTEVLRAGSVAYTKNNSVAIDRRPVTSAEESLSWRHGYLVFRDTALADAVAEFNRYNSHKMVVADAQIAGLRIGGNFRATSTDVFLWMLQNGFPVTVEEREGRTVIQGH